MIRLSRRSALPAFLVVLFPLAAAAAPSLSSDAPAAPLAPKKLVFKIMRKGSPIGQYTIRISSKGPFTVVDVTTQIKVTVLFLTAYQLSQAGREIWKGDQFVSYKGKTDENGKMHVVSIVAGKDKTTVVSNGHRSIAPEGAIPASLWNAQFLKEQVLIDPADGRQVPIKVVDMGLEPVTVQGQREMARHYHIHGLKRDVWMMKGEPVRFQLIGSDHSRVVSELQPTG